MLKTFLVVLATKFNIDVEKTSKKNNKDRGEPLRKHIRSMNVHFEVVSRRNAPYKKNNFEDEKKGDSTKTTNVSVN